jgi:hypothetical protein
MTKFGTLKVKILQKLVEAYAMGRKEEIKDTLKLMKENKEFLNLYLFYEEIENKTIEDKEHAELFVEEIIPLLQKHSIGINKFCKQLDKKVGSSNVLENDVYSNLDILSEADSLRSVDKKIIARKKLSEYLTKKKSVPDITSTEIIENTFLLNTVLSNNFNVLYSNTLNEDEKTQLTEILSTSNEDLKSKFTSLQEEVTTKMGALVSEEKNNELKDKLNLALTEAKSMDVTKFNYYKLQQLKKGL